MKILKAYKFKLKANRKLLNQLQIFSGHARFVWNKALALNLYKLKNRMPIMYYQELDFWTKLWKKSCGKKVVEKK